MEETYKCSHCGRELPRSAFPSNKSKKLGIASMCKECTNEYVRKWYKRKLTEQKPSEKSVEKSSLDGYSNSELIKFLVSRGVDVLANPTPRDLILRLKSLGYTGTLEYVERKTISLREFN